MTKIVPPTRYGILLCFGGAAAIFFVALRRDNNFGGSVLLCSFFMNPYHKWR